MLEHFFKEAELREALRANHLGWAIEEAAAHFHSHGHKVRYVRQVLLIISRFGDWLAVTEIPLETVDTQHTEEFRRQYMPPRRRDTVRSTKPCATVRASLRLALNLILARHPKPVEQTPVQTEVADYLRYLRRDRGLATGTIEHHERHLTAFLESRFGDQVVDLAAVTPEQLHAHMHALPKMPSNSNRRHFSAALRSYLRYAELTGRPVAGLATASPVVPAARPSVSPKTVSAKEMARLLDVVDRSTGVGKRTYAVLLCLADLGIRVGDVAHLELDDVDWRAGTIRVANVKRRRPYQLPLPNRLGEALADYLRHGRPISTSRAFFLQRAKPEWVQVTAHALKASVRRTWNLAGLGGRYNGTHILRRTAATNMRQAGAPLKSIADVLGHDSLQVVGLYAQVDLPALRGVAQPWPGGVA